MAAGQAVRRLPLSDIFRTGRRVLPVEVADTSVERDLEVKLPLYARVGTPEAWLVDLHAMITEIYSRPDSDGYRETLWAKRCETVASLTITDLEVAANDTLG